MQLLTIYGIPVEISGYKSEIKRGIVISCLIHAIELHFSMLKNRKITDADFLKLFHQRHPDKKFIMQPGNHQFKQI